MRLFVSTAILALALPLAAQAQDERPFPKIVVSGKGEAAVAPDMAIVNLAVLREAETARAALDENNDAMADVIAAMKEAGIADRDLQTAGLSINPRYVYPQNNDGTEQPRIVAYQVTNNLTIRIRDIEKVGEILDQSVTLGVNQGGSISFVNDDPSAATAEARRKAVEDAMGRARTLAEAAGVTLGDVIEMSERTAPPPMPMQERAMMRMSAADAGGSVPVETGENNYVVHVDVTFAIGGGETPE